MSIYADFISTDATYKASFDWLDTMTKRQLITTVMCVRRNSYIPPELWQIIVKYLARLSPRPTDLSLMHWLNQKMTSWPIDNPMIVCKSRKKANAYLRNNHVDIVYYTAEVKCCGPFGGILIGTITPIDFCYVWNSKYNALQTETVDYIYMSNSKRINRTLTFHTNKIIFPLYNLDNRHRICLGGTTITALFAVTNPALENAEFTGDRLAQLIHSPTYGYNYNSFSTRLGQSVVHGEIDASTYERKRKERVAAFKKVLDHITVNMNPVSQRLRSPSLANERGVAAIWDFAQHEMKQLRK